MKRSVYPSEINGELEAPPSKSESLRMITAAALAVGTSCVRNVSDCDDVKTMISIWEVLGINFSGNFDELYLSGRPNFNVPEIDCGESGLCGRMFMALASLSSRPVLITGKSSLLRRPLGCKDSDLKDLNIIMTSKNGRLPVLVQGPAKSGSLKLHGNITSQFLTGMLFTLPLTAGRSQIEVYDLQSKPYIAMTLDALRKSGIKIKNENFELFSITGNQQYCVKELMVEGDWSSVAFMLIAAAIAGTVEIIGLNNKSYQADIKIVEVLKKAGASVKMSTKVIRVEKSELNGFIFDATDSPDLVPALVALAANCKGESIITGIQRLKHKESNRLAALKLEFGKLGINIKYDDQKMTVRGGKVLGAKVVSQGDHRIAMALAIAALRAEGPVQIGYAGCIAKSYPSFFNDLIKIGGRVK